MHSPSPGLLAQLFALGLLLSLQSIPAQAWANPLTDSPETESVDPLFPQQGRGSLSVATGIPFVGLAEAAMGLTPNAALGVLVGTTPQVRAWGLRPRFRLLRRGGYELSTTWLMLHYPRNHELDAPPWMLGRPTLHVTRSLGGRALIGVNTGLAGAITMARIARRRGKPDYSDGAGGFRSYESKRPLTAGLWWTAGAQAAFQASERFTLFAEASVVLAGTKLADSDWVGAIPTIVALGVSVSL